MNHHRGWWVISGVCALFLALPTQAQAQIRVSTTGELVRVLQSAKGGETVELAPGTYERLVIDGRGGKWPAYSKAVTVKSADRQALARFPEVQFKNIGNIALVQIEFRYSYSSADKINVRPFSIQGADNITIADCRFVGDAATGTSTIDDGFGYGIGLEVSTSRNVVVERSSFANWHRGAVFHRMDGLNVRGNDITNIRSDGMNFAQVSNVVIEGNHFHGFRTAQKSTDHPDMIQFWTNKTSEPTTNIVIRRNLLDMADGRWTQSIFMRNEEVDNKRAGREMFYRNIEISDNLIRNAHVHGITVGETDGLTIARNTLIQGVDSPRPLHVTVPGINIAASSDNVKVENNISPRIADAKPGWAYSGNLKVQRNFPNSRDFYTNVFVDALTSGDVPLHKLQLLPGGLVTDPNLGSSLGKFNERPRVPLALVDSASSTRGRNAPHEFSVRAVYGPSGKIGIAGASVNWEFSDGGKASGEKVTYQFPYLGRHRASVTVQLKDGTIVRGDRTISTE